jgi:hypothetical protein
MAADTLSGSIGFPSQGLLTGLAASFATVFAVHYFLMKPKDAKVSHLHTLIKLEAIL